MIKKTGEFVFVLLSGLPLALVGIAASFGVVGMILLLQEKLTNSLVWPIGFLVSVIVVWLVLRSQKNEQTEHKKEQIICDVIAMVAIVLWCVWNVGLSSQHILTDSDPATYANASAWLVNHSTLQIYTANPFGDVQQIGPGSPGFDNVFYDTGRVYAQGQHLSQVLMGLGGRLVGIENVLMLAPITGGLALLAVYSFARRLARPRWALVAIAVLGVSLPFIHFSREAFTEPLAMSFIFGTLVALWTASKNGRLEAWLLASLFAGAAIMTRIDSYLAIIGIVLYVLINLALTAPRKRKSSAIGSAMFLSGVVVFSWLAMQDLKILSLPYFLFHKEYIKQEIIALCSVVIAGAAVVAVCWKTKLLKWLDKLTRSWRAVAVPILIIGSTLVLASRPIWMTAESPRQGVNIASIQSREGVPIEPRIYTELTVDWVVWYIGPITAVLGIIGASLIAAGVMRSKKQIAALAIILMFVATAAVYMVQPSVSPAQIWASRRMLPVIMPSLMVFGAAVMDMIDRKYLNKITMGGLFAVFMGASVVITPLIVSKPFLATKQMVELSLIQGVCDSLPKNAAVLWIGDGQYYMVQATRSFCGATTMAYKSNDVDIGDISDAISNAKKAGYVPVLATMGDRVEGIKDQLGYKFKKVGEATVSEMENRLLGPPRFSEEKVFKTYISVIGE